MLEQKCVRSPPTEEEAAAQTLSDELHNINKRDFSP